MSNALYRLALRLERAERNIKALGKPQLANSSVEGGGAIDVNDEDGNTVMQVGGQFDGSYIAAPLSGPTPPTPTAPVLEAVPGGVKVRWDGLWADADQPNMDYSRIEVHASPVEVFDSAAATYLRGTIETPRGGELIVSLPEAEHWFVFVARSQAGKGGEESAKVSATPLHVPTPAEVAEAAEDAADALAAEVATDIATAKAQAIATAGGDAQVKADLAQAAAIAAAATDATTKAGNAQTAAVSAAAIDATTKSANAQAAAIAAAATDATTKAGNAQTAAIASALTDAAAKVAAISASNANPYFADWPSGTYPTGYSASSTAPTKETTLVRSSSPYAMRWNVSATGVGHGVFTNATALPLTEYVTVTLDVYLVSGTFGGTHVLLDWVGLGTAQQNRVTWTLANDIPSPQTGRWYRLSKVLRRPADLTGTHTGWSAFFFANYTGLAGQATKDIVLGGFGLRPSSQAEILAYGAADYVASRGTNLVTNGTGLLGDNTNFSGFTYTKADAPNGMAGSFVTPLGSTTTKLSDELMPVDSGKKFRLSMLIRQTGTSTTATCYVGLQPFDAYKLAIDPSHYMWVAGTNTTLAVDLVAGATTITLTDATNWWGTAGKNAGGSTHLRRIIFWDYVDAGGKAWPQNTYSRNVSAVDFWADGGIASNVITLRAPYAGPTHLAGTKVSNGSSGGTYLYMPTVQNVVIPQTWTAYGDSITGVFTNSGNGSAASFANGWPYGTGFTRIITLPNRTPGGAADAASQMAFSGLSFSDAAAAAYDANNITATQITDGAITTPKLAAGSVDAGKIAAGAVTAGKIAADAVTANEIAANAVTASEIAAGAVVAGKIAADAVTANEIAANAVTASEIAAGAVVAGKIAADAVTANEIAANAVTASEIATDAVTAGKIQAGAVIASKIAAGSVTADKVVLGDLGNMCEVSESVAGNITYGAWTTAIASGWATRSGTKNQYFMFRNQKGPLPFKTGDRIRVTFDAYASSALTGVGLRLWTYGDSSPLQNIAGLVNIGTSAASYAYEATVTVNTDLKTAYLIGLDHANLATTDVFVKNVRAYRMGAGELIVDGGIVAGKIAADAITANEIAANAIGASEISAGAVVAGKLAADSVATSNLIAGSIVSDKIASEAVLADHIKAGSVDAARLSSVIAVISKLCSAETGRRWEADQAGIRMFDVDGSLLVNFPTDPSTPASITGDLVATSLTVSDQLAIRGLVNEISKGAQLVLASGTTAPSSPPAVSIDWPYVDTHYAQDNNPAYDAFNDPRYGWVRFDGKYRTAQTIYAAKAQIQAYEDTGHPVALQTPIQTQVDEGIGGVAVAGSNIYVLGYVTQSDFSKKWYVEGYNNVGVQQSRWEYVLASGSRTPKIGSDGTNLVIAYTTTTANVLVWQKRNPATGATVGSTVSSNTGLSKEMSAFWYGTGDFGAERAFFACGGDATAYSTTAAGVYTSNENFPLPSTAIRGIAYDGGVFISHDASAHRRYTHSTLKWTTESAVWWSSVTWHDPNTTGGTHETAQGPRKQFTMKKRAHLTVTIPPLPLRPVPNTSDDATTARIYLARGVSDPGRNYMERATTLPDGTLNYTLSSFTFPATTAVSPPPATSDFPASSPAKITSADGSTLVLQGDGSGNWGTISVSSTGVVSGVPRSIDGQVSVPAVASGAASAAIPITFPAGLFSAAPKVFVSTNAGRLTPFVTSITTTGANLNFNNWSPATTGTATAQWFAVQST